MNKGNLFIQRCLGGGAVLSAASSILVIGFWQSAEAQSAGAATLTVHIAGTRNAKGQIRAALFLALFSRACWLVRTAPALPAQKDSR